MHCHHIRCVLQVKAKVDMGFWGGLIPANAGDHDALWSLMKAGASGFKSFMPPSGINDFPHVSRADVEAAMPFLMAKGAPYFVHAEVVHDVETDQVMFAYDRHRVATRIELSYIQDAQVILFVLR